MSEHSRQEVARRVGVDIDYVDRLVELGILRPGAGDAFWPGDVRRARVTFTEMGPVELRRVSGTPRLSLPDGASEAEGADRRSGTADD